MTTFNELLGAKPHEPIEVVKQRYKLLSLRVHPDKGGTQALMLLVRYAYENIKAGKGENKLTLPDADLGTKRENEELKEKLKQAKIEEIYVKNLKLERGVKQLEKQVSMLKEERRHLLLRKETEQTEKLRLAKELKRVLLDNALNEKNKKQHNIFDKPWIANLALIIALFCLFWIISFDYLG